MLCSKQWLSDRNKFRRKGGYTTKIIQHATQQLKNEQRAKRVAHKRVDTYLIKHLNAGLLSKIRMLNSGLVLQISTIMKKAHSH